MSFTLESTIKLASGHSIPLLGLGVYQARAKECENAVIEALKVGYRHVDSAQGYHNEELVGRAVVASGINRSSIFLTTKYMPSHNVIPTKEVYEVIQKSLKKLNRQPQPKGKEGGDDEQYIDLMLIHAPFGGPKGRANNWEALVKAQKEGWIRDIGVSNFGVKHLEDLPSPQPTINQIELHPWCQQREIVSYCKSKGIIVQAYCPIVRGDQNKLSNPTLVKIAQKHKKEAVHVLIRWSLQKGYVPLVKSVTPSRIASNANVYDFNLDEQDMKDLDSLDQGAKGAISWNPVDIE